MKQGDCCPALSLEETLNIVTLFFISPCGSSRLNGTENTDLQSLLLFVGYHNGENVHRVRRVHNNRLQRWKRKQRRWVSGLFFELIFCNKLVVTHVHLAYVTYDFHCRLNHRESPNCGIRVTIRVWVSNRLGLMLLGLVSWRPVVLPGGVNHGVGESWPMKICRRGQNVLTPKTVVG